MQESTPFGPATTATTRDEVLAASGIVPTDKDTVMPTKLVLCTAGGLVADRRTMVGDAVSGPETELMIFGTDQLASYVHLVFKSAGKWWAIKKLHFYKEFIRRLNYAGMSNYILGLGVGGISAHGRGGPWGYISFQMTGKVGTGSFLITKILSEAKAFNPESLHSLGLPESVFALVMPFQSDEMKCEDLSIACNSACQQLWVGLRGQNVFDFAEKQKAEMTEASWDKIKKATFEAVLASMVESGAISPQERDAYLARQTK